MLPVRTISLQDGWGESLSAPGTVYRFDNIGTEIVDANNDTRPVEVTMIDMTLFDGVTEDDMLFAI
ncbi:MAG: hypothetical protein LBR80_03265 [Deltaproteobacteria bacterium]|jgi:hypothetical protein|nr:hypothetical protein [Deltaproteobacteria bacterium]